MATGIQSCQRLLLVLEDDDCLGVARIGGVVVEGAFADFLLLDFFHPKSTEVARRCIIFVVDWMRAMMEVSKNRAIACVSAAIW